ncbi:MAG TPA: adenylate/guanylate cyclase domain-containing protein [Acidimicrobiia bacterium]|nr:adenylate/guanylate cyclase domain-containing protein [Acidimicrobiia bacterium]
MTLPSGVVTFVFSDIEGSTKLWESDPEGMRVSLAQHDEIVRRIIEGAKGTVFKHTGDGFGAAFDTVRGGVEAAARIAAALSNMDWKGPALASRIGVHTGEAEPTEGDYFGATVTRTARIMDAGNGGQILVSEAARQLFGDRLGASMSLVDMGEHRLKDLGEPTQIYRLMAEGAEDPRRLRTLEWAPHNLPIQLSTFIGRQGQIKEIADFVRQSRLVTLTGIGGVGKTRLALQVAAELLPDFEHGVWFVELASLTDAGFLAETVASALGVPQDPLLTAEARLMKFLPDRRALLVIDNCEHLIEPVAALVDSLLRTCPDVHVLTTSRESLAVPGEVLWRVPSLRVDDDAAAVELFAERARLVQPGFTVNDDNIEAIADLCVRLDGIPLAIELATARLKMLSLDQIAANLSDRFRLLTGGSRTAVERQRTLRAMMDWSYDLLSDQERALLRRLSVFSDGFSYEGAEELCSGETLSRRDVLDLLGHLVEASVVNFDADVSPRYRLLETVRQYALDKLVDADEANEARLRHAEFFRAATQKIDASLLAGDVGMIKIAADDLANYRAAMTWASDAGHSSLALELACNLRTYFWESNMWRESLDWLTSALNRVEDHGSPFVAVGTAYALTEAVNIGGETPILALAERARRILADSTDDLPRGLLTNSLAALEMATDVRRADQLKAQASALLRSANDPRWVAPIQHRLVAAWLMNSREAEHEILSLIDEAGALVSPERRKVHQLAFKVLAEEYDEVIAATESLSPIDLWAKNMMLLYRMQAQRATGIRRLRSSPASDSSPGPVRSPMGGRDGNEGWHTCNSAISTPPSQASVPRGHTPRMIQKRATGPMSPGSGR